MRFLANQGDLKTPRAPERDLDATSKSNSSKAVVVVMLSPTPLGGFPNGRIERSLLDLFARKSTDRAARHAALTGGLSTKPCGARPWTWQGGFAVSASANSATLATLGLVGLPLAYLGIYLATIALTLRLVGASKSVLELAGLFITTFVPIAIAYDIAHNLSFLALGAQYLVPILSDPLGIG